MKTMYIKVTLVFLCLMVFMPAYSQLVKPDLNLKREGPKYDSVMVKPNKSKPLFVDGNNANKDVGSNLVYSCVITPFSASLGGVVSFEHYSDFKKRLAESPDSMKVAIREYRGKASYAWIGSKSIKEILKYLYGKPYRYDTFTTLLYMPQQVPNSRVAFAKDVDTTGLVTFFNNTVRRQNNYTIQLTTSTDASNEQMAKMMRTSIEFQFGLTCVWERQKKKCIVFSPNGIPIPVHTEGNPKMRSGNATTGKYHLLLNNVKIEKLFDKLEDYFPFTQYPFIDETGFTKQLGNFEFYTDEPELTYKSLRESLSKLGIKLSIEDREVDVLVIRKAK